MPNRKKVIWEKFIYRALFCINNQKEYLKLFLFLETVRQVNAKANKHCFINLPHGSHPQWSFVIHILFWIIINNWLKIYNLNCSHWNFYFQRFHCVIFDIFKMAYVITYLKKGNIFPWIYHTTCEVELMIIQLKLPVCTSPVLSCLLSRGNNYFHSCC